MAQKTRLLGRDVQIRLALGGVPLSTITAVKNFTWNINHRVLTEGFLGETGNRKDGIYDDVSGSFQIHPESPDAFVLAKAIADKTISRSASELQVSITMRCTFPSGKTAKVFIGEVEFAPTTVNVGGRDAYVEMNFSWEAEKFTVIAG